MNRDIISSTGPDDYMNEKGGLWDTSNIWFSEEMTM